MGEISIGRPLDPQWLEDVHRLESSANPAVKKAITAIGQSIKWRQDVVKMLEDTKVKNAQAVAENTVDVGDLVTGMLPENASLDDIERAVTTGQITHAQAEAYRAGIAAQDKAFWSFAKMFGTILANSSLAESGLRLLHGKAEVLEADAAAEHLTESLRARAGKAVTEAPRNVVVGAAPNRRGELNLLVAILPSAQETLTQMTLMLDIRSGMGRRHAVVYVPRLAPGEGVQVSPIPYDTRLGLKPNEEDKTERTIQIRYHVWCDQFTFESEEGPVAGLAKSRAAYCALAAQPGRGYDLISKNRLDKSGYRLEFEELTPDGDAYRVRGTLSAFETRDRQTASKQAPFQGVIRGSASVTGPAAAKGPAKGKKTTTTRSDRADDVQLSITSSLGNSEIGLSVEDGGVSWQVKSGLGANSLVYPVSLTLARLEKAKTADKWQQVNAEVRRLISVGKKDEAVQMLRDYIDSNPAEREAASARFLLKELESTSGFDPKNPYLKGRDTLKKLDIPFPNGPGAKPSTTTGPKRF